MPRKNEGTIYVATESFSVDIGGRSYSVSAGRTRVREGHELLKGDRAAFFKPIDVDYDVEQATSAPGEKRGE